MKRQFPMMLLLIFHILNSFINNRLTNRKCRISTLPRKIMILGIERLYPSATISFHLLNQMRNSLIP